MSNMLIAIDEGKWKGVTYRIKVAEVVEEAEGPLLKFDYEVKGLAEADSAEFEAYLGDFIKAALWFEKEQDKTKDIMLSI